MFCAHLKINRDYLPTQELQVFLTATERVYCAVRTESLNRVPVTFSPYGTNKVNFLCSVHYFPSHLLTHSTVQSPSWAANWFAASQEIPRISRNPKVHYRTHKRSPTVLILGQPNLVHIPTSHLLQIHPNIIHPSMPRSLQWSLSLRFPHQDRTPPSPLPIRATCPAHLILLDFITRTILCEQYRSTAVLCYLKLLRLLVRNVHRSKFKTVHNVSTNKSVSILRRMVGR